VTGAVDGGNRDDAEIVPDAWGQARQDHGVVRRGGRRGRG
jgi:hypothetical protein